MVWTVFERKPNKVQPRKDRVIKKDIRVLGILNGEIMVLRRETWRNIVTVTKGGMNGLEQAKKKINK